MPRPRSPWRRPRGRPAADPAPPVELRPAEPGPDIDLVIDDGRAADPTRTDPAFIDLLDGAAGGRPPGRLRQAMDRARVAARAGWVRASRWERLVLVTTALLVIVAAAFSVAAVRAAPTDRTVVRERITAVPRPAVDALGCPAGRVCTQRSVPAARLGGVQQAVPGAVVVVSSETVDTADAVVYRREVVLTATGIRIRFDSLCVPGGAAVREVPMTLLVTNRNGTTDVPAGEDAPAGIRQLSATTAGAAGCSVFVYALSTTASDLFAGLPLDYRLRVLADQPDLVVTQ